MELAKHCALIVCLVLVELVLSARCQQINNTEPFNSTGSTNDSLVDGKSTGAGENFTMPSPTSPSQTSPVSTSIVLANDSSVEAHFTDAANGTTSSPMTPSETSEDDNATEDTEPPTGTRYSWSTEQDVASPSDTTPPTTGPQPPISPTTLAWTRSTLDATIFSTAVDIGNPSMNQTDDNVTTSVPTTSNGVASSMPVTTFVGSDSGNESTESLAPPTTKTGMTTTTPDNSDSESSDTMLDSPAAVAGISLGALALMLIPVMIGVRLHTNSKARVRQSASVRSASFKRVNIKNGNKVPLTEVDHPNMSNGMLVTDRPSESFPNPYAEFAEANMVSGGMTWDWPKLEPVIPRSASVHSTTSINL